MFEAYRRSVVIAVGLTHATFPMLFNALYLAAAEREEVRTPSETR